MIREQRSEQKQLIEKEKKKEKNNLKPTIKICQLDIHQNDIIFLELKFVIHVTYRKSYPLIYI